MKTLVDTTLHNKYYNDVISMAVTEPSTLVHLHVTIEDDLITETLLSCIVL